MSRSRYEELLAEGYYYGVTADLLEEVHSKYQHIEVLKSPLFGKLLRIDGALQCSEADEAWYHEPLVHLAISRVTNPKHVLIIGGGDGGSAEEALKWPSVQRVDMVEIDSAVIDLSRRHLQSLHGGLLHPNQDIDYRFHLHIGDGWDFILGLKSHNIKVDVLILDLTDPGGASLQLWDENFYQDCVSVLQPNGVASLHVGAPWAQQTRCLKVLGLLRQFFPLVQPFITTIPVSGGAWMMALAHANKQTKTPTLEEVKVMLDCLQGPRLKVIDPIIMQAMLQMAHRW